MTTGKLGTSLSVLVSWPVVISLSAVAVAVVLAVLVPTRSSDDWLLTTRLPRRSVYVALSSRLPSVHLTPRIRYYPKRQLTAAMTCLFFCDGTSRKCSWFTLGTRVSYLQATWFFTCTS
jgi:hypothetical protein